MLQSKLKDASRRSIFANENSEQTENGLNSHHVDAANKTNRENLNLALRNLDCIPEFIIKRYGKYAKTLDLSFNAFSEVNNLYCFEQLDTLVLDHNHISCQTTFPILSSLKMLSLNNNRISNLSIFIKNLAQSFNQLKYLSMMNNLAAPSYLNGGSVEQFQDYRNFVISHFPFIEVLDCTRVTEEEQQNAYTVYGRRWKLKRRSQTIKSKSN